MKNWPSKAIWLSAALLVLSFGARADTLQLSGASGPGNTGYVTGPYQVTDLTTNTTIPVICDDFNVDVTLGETWNATAYTLANLSSLAFGSSDPGGLDPSNLLHQYQAAFYLANLLYSLPNTSANAQEINDLSYAIWGIFSSSARNQGGYDQAAINFDDAALGLTYGANQYFNELIYTPDIPGSSQEYLTDIDPTNTPEPSSYALLTLGLMGLMGCAVYRQRNRRAAARA